jgi:Kef-type K+ transport system membrane component KefB
VNALLLAQLAAILLAARVAGFFVRRVGQPRVIGEMAAGIALGPSLFGVFAPGAMATLFPADAMAPLAAVSQLGIVLFMFVVGLRLDAGLIRRKAGAAVFISQASIVVPFGLGIALAPWLHPNLAGPGVPLLPFGLFVGAAMSVTAFPVLARILEERGMVGTRYGSLAIACAAADDVAAWCLLAAVVAAVRSGHGLAPFLVAAGGAAAYAILLVTVGRLLLARWNERRGEREIGPDLVAACVVFALLSALATELLGVHALFGAFLAGACVPRAHGVAAGVAGRLEAVVATVLLPVFFAFTGLRTAIPLIAEAHGGLMLAAILGAAVAGKLGGSAIAARISGLEWRDAIGLGVLMNTRGLMELVILNVGLEIGVISPALFAMMVVMALVTTVMAAPLLSALLGSDLVFQQNVEIQDLTPRGRKHGR